ncbi:MAG TPA: acyltransferase family protein, partial [Thermomicrobiales bacterium]|nr:acyltransferase family protein [Thermomicrobiales bacterium]
AWPLLLIGTMALARKRRLRAWCLAILLTVVAMSLTWSIAQTASNGTAAYFSPLTRAWELGLGGVVALTLPWIRRAPVRMAEPAALVGLAGIALAATTYGPTTVFPGSAALVPVIGTCLLLAAGAIRVGTQTERMLSLAPFQIVGRWSYSIYLWHWPILVLAAAWLDRDLTVGEGLVLAMGSVGLAGLTYSLIERPVRDASRLRKGRPIVSIGMGAALTASVLLVASTVLISAPHETIQGGDVAQTVVLPSEQLVLSAVEAGVSQKNWPAQPKRIANPAYAGDCNVTRAKTSAVLCVHGDPSATDVAVILGDSHGAMWVPALDLIGKEQGWQIVQMTKPGCQAPDFPRYSPTMKREYTECAQFRNWALAQIARLHPDLVLIASSSRDVQQWTDSGPSDANMEDVWGDGLAKVLQRVAPVADRVIVIGDMPYPDEPGIDCLTSHPDDAAACNTDRAEAVPATMNIVEQQTAQANGAEWVDVTPWFCTSSICPAVIGDLTVHRDNFHVNENYAVWLANVLGQAIGLIPIDRPMTAVHLPQTLTT